jgi:DNA-binding response OmpR family regulator
MNSMQKRILLVEDEDSLAVGLEFNLKEEGYSISRVKDGRQALETVFSESFDLIILDIMIPHIDGFEVAKKIREKNAQIPILMLTARAGIKDRIKGLETGADDYLPKPFHLEELLLRVQGMLRRKEWYTNSSERLPNYRFGKNFINFKSFTAISGNKQFNLTYQEAMLLRYLIEQKDKVVSRKELLENVWHINPDIETRTVDNFIKRLRKYFEPNPEKPIYFKSIRGAGYKFCEPTTD